MCIYIYTCIVMQSILVKLLSRAVQTHHPVSVLGKSHLPLQAGQEHDHPDATGRLGLRLRCQQRKHIYHSKDVTYHNQNIIDIIYHFNRNMISQ